MNAQVSNTEMSSFLNKNNSISTAPAISDSTAMPSTSQRFGLYAIGAYLRKQNVSFSMVGYTILFFSCMVLMEIVLEALMHQFPNLDSMATSVTLFQLGICVLIPLVLSQGTALQRFPRQTDDFIPYIFLSVLVFGATGLATQSVKYVSFPTKVVFKSSKLIPTMFVASIVQRKIYSTTEYLAAVFLCMGAAGYAYGGTSLSATGRDSSYGIVLLIISVFCDAVVPNVQKLLLSKANNDISHLGLPNISTDNGTKTNTVTTNFGGLSADELMVNTNAMGFGMLFVYMIFTDHMREFVETCFIQPLLFVYLVTVGTCLAVAVSAYMRLIQESGSVFAVGVATLRKVASVVLSFVLFPKPLLLIHVVSGILVLGGILLSTTPKKRTG